MNRRQRKKREKLLAEQPKRIVICDEICPRCGMHTILNPDGRFFCLECKKQFLNNQIVKSKEKISKEEKEEILKLAKEEKNG